MNKKYKYGIVMVIILGILFRFGIVSFSNFPYSDGGMFYVMIKDLIKNNWQIPQYTSYNFIQIPFAYSPLAFYTGAFLHNFLKIDLLILFKILPLLISCLSILVFLAIINLLFKKNSISFFSLLFFVTSPRSFEALITGGGLTRSFGFLFALLSVYYALGVTHLSSKKKILLAGFCFGMSILFHMEFARFTVISLMAVYLACGSYKKNFLSFIGIGTVAGIMVLPNIMWVFHLHGSLAPYLNAMASNLNNSSQLNFWNSYTTSQASYLYYIAESKFSLIAFFALVGFLIAIFQKHKFVVLWFIFSLIFPSRNLHTTLAPVLSIFAGMTFSEFVQIIHKNTNVRIYKNLLLEDIVLIYMIFISFFSLVSAFGQSTSVLSGIRQQEFETMKWIESNTPQSSSFLVISPYPGWLWFADYLPEWFPAIAARQSISTPQGKEWLTDFRGALKFNEELKECNNSNIECFQSVAKKYLQNFDYVYLPANMSLEPDIGECCTLLKASLLSSPNYEIVFQNKEEYVFRKRLTFDEIN